MSFHTIINYHALFNRGLKAMVHTGLVMFETVSYIA